MATSVSATSHATYQAHHRDTLLSEVACVYLLLLPRGLVLAGFSEDGTVLVIRHSSYSHEFGEWAIHFYEEEFISDPLLGVPTQVKALFVLSDQHLIVPDELYEEQEARAWLQSLHHLDHDAWIRDYQLPADNAHYVYTLPEPMHRLLERYFGHTSVMPLAAYQGYKPDGHPWLLQCLITEEQVVATLRSKGRLLWHQIFRYSEVTDVAWQFAHLCRHYHIPQIDLRLECTTLSDSGYDLVTDLETFFPKLKCSNHQIAEEGRWAPVIYLLQQLHACAL